MFAALKTGGYIDSSNDINDWMAIFGREKQQNSYKPIVWLAGPFKLGQFIDKAFGRTNTNCLWENTTANFIINGKVPNKGSIKEGASKACRGESKYDEILLKIAHTK